MGSEQPEGGYGAGHYSSLTEQAPRHVQRLAVIFSTNLIVFDLGYFFGCHSIFDSSA